MYLDRSQGAQTQCHFLIEYALKEQIGRARHQDDEAYLSDVNPR